MVLGRPDGTTLSTLTGYDTHSVLLDSDLNPETLPVRLCGAVVFGTLTSSGRAQSHYGAWDSASSQNYSINFNNQNTKNPFSLQVNDTTVEIGSAGDQVSNDIWEFDVIFSQESSSSTQVDYSIYQNGELYATDSVIIDDAVSEGTVFNEVFLQFRQRALIAFDDLRIFSYESEE